MVEAAKVFNPDDFEALRLFIQFENNTTHTEVKGQNEVLLIELGPKTLVLEIPKNSANNNHSLLIQIYRIKSKRELKDPKKKKKNSDSSLVESLFHATGKITKVEEADAKHIKVHLKLVQFDEKSWKKFVGIFSKRQDEISKFLEDVRGY